MTNTLDPSIITDVLQHLDNDTLRCFKLKDYNYNKDYLVLYFEHNTYKYTIEYNKDYYLITECNSNVNNIELNILSIKLAYSLIDLLKAILNFKSMNTYNTLNYMISNEHTTDLPFDLNKCNEYKKNFINCDFKKIPEKYLLTNNKIIQLLQKDIQTIKLTNNNWDVTLEDNIIYCVNVTYNIPVQSNLYKLVKDKKIVFNINYNPYVCPYSPPKLLLSKPFINNSFKYGLNSLQFLKINNWNPSNSLLNIIEYLEYLVENYITDVNESTDTNDVLSKMLMSIYDSCGVFKTDMESFDIPYNKICGKINTSTTDTTTNNSQKTWSSGVGYGHGNNSNWDITKFINDQAAINENISNKFTKLISTIDDVSYEILDNKYLWNIIYDKISGINIMDIDKSYNLLCIFVEYMLLMSDFKLKSNDQLIKIFKSLKEMYDNLKDIQDDSMLNLLNNIECLLMKWNKYDEKQIEFVKSDENIYVDTMIKHQFDKHPFIENKVYSVFSTLPSGTPSKECMMRISKEYSVLKKSLPLNESSTIWMRIDPKNIRYNKFMISGPKDTPYENGLFLFNTIFPNDYPKTAPSVLLETTLGKKYRFNPNLYNCGKVCLSLLGTWSGHGGETWNTDNSTFLQVLVSIQSLILVEDPYFNEPSYERTMHTAQGKQASFEYCDDVRIHNIIIAMTNNINNPPPGFEDIVKEHFKIKKDDIIKQVNKWSDESIRRKDLYVKYTEELIKALDSL
jgi:ubiquitin-protein ligase